MDILSNAYIQTHFDNTRMGSAATASMLQAYEFGVAKTIFEKLWEHYPGYDWKVKVDSIGGIATVQLPRLHHSTIAYIVKLDDMASDPNLLTIRKAGGELLERFKLVRARVNRAEYTDAIRNRPFAFRKSDYIDGGFAAENKAKWTHGQNTIIRAAA
jgi:hypothetical protein